jgi:hypothetical protein
VRGQAARTPRRSNFARTDSTGVKRGGGRRENTKRKVQRRGFNECRRSDQTRSSRQGRPLEQGVDLGFAGLPIGLKSDAGCIPCESVGGGGQWWADVAAGLPLGRKLTI